MPVPVPEYALENVCTAIFGNTLYTYSNTAFQSLELTEGATWKTLSMGVRTEGSVCVKTTPVNNTDTAALWIVGGTTSETYYHGLQKYTFKSQQWETIKTMDPVAQNRMWHGAAYLNKSDSILLFAGTQDGTRQASSQTFTIDAKEPYAVTAYESIAPPAIKPMVIPWTQSKAIYVGGSETNTKVMIFSPSESWEDSNATLTTPLYNCSNIQAVVQNGNDASKTLYTFDMTVVPNSVNRTILIDADGNPVANAAPITAQNVQATEADRNVDEEIGGRSLQRRGNLTVANWPVYNDTLAPASTRKNFAVARDQSGMTVITGGNTDDVLCIFKARDNCWVNATEKFTAQAVAEPRIGDTPTTLLPGTTPTDTPADRPTESSSPTPGAPFPVKILGAVLGSVIGVALVLIALLFFLKWKKKRRAFFDAGHQRRSSGLPDEKMDFQDIGLPHVSTTRQLRHGPQNSFSSMANLLGRVGSHNRGCDKGNGSVASESSSQFNRDYKAAIGKPTPIGGGQVFRTMGDPIADEKAPTHTIATNSATPKPRGFSKAGRLGSTRRSSGWNMYWSGGSTLNLFGFGKRNTVVDDERSDRDSGSQYSNPRGPSQVTRASAIVPPLRFGDRPPEMQRVNSGSPTVHNNAQFPFTRASVAQVQRPGSVSTLSSFDGERDAFSSGVPESVYDEFSTTRQSSNIFSDSNFPLRNTQQLHPPVPSSHQSQFSTDMSWLNLGDQRRS